MELLITLIAAGAAGGLAAFWAKMDERARNRRTIVQREQEFDQLWAEAYNARQAIVRLLKVAEQYSPRTSKRKIQRIEALKAGRDAL